MTTYRNILESERDARSPMTDELAAALALNPTAIAEGAADAPFLQTAWHPYNETNVEAGDGNLYDGSTTPTDIASPTFTAGYEYMMRAVGLDVSAVSNVLLQLNLSSSGWTTLKTISGVSGGGLTGDWFVIAPDETGIYGINSYSGLLRVSDGTDELDSRITGLASGQTVTGMRMAAATGGFTTGDVYLLRRRHFRMGD
jgi:hypothetical protein